MNFRAFVIAALALIVPSFAFSQDDKPHSDSPKTVISMVERPAYFALQPAGLFKDLTLTTYGMQFGYALEESVQAVVSFNRGSQGSSYTDDQTLAHYVQAEMRFFPSSRSFYISGGLAYRRFDIRNEVPDQTSKDREVTYTSHAFGSDVQIGNQWRWDRMLLGCDWFGVFFPIFETEASIKRPDNVSDDNFDDIKKELRDDGRGVNFQFLRFYIGYRF